MAQQLTPLEQVKADAEYLTRKRIAEQEESKTWQEAQDGPVSLDDKPEVAVEKTEKKGK